MIDRDLFKRTMRQWAAGVTIITIGSPGRAHGMTANSFTSVSCTPPLMLVCVDRGNDTHRLVRVGEKVGINLLSETQIDLSSRFASKTAARYQFHDLDWSAGPNGTILFRNCAAMMEATIAKAYEAGDHTIFIGEILWADVDGGKKPLVYSQGSYARLVPIPADPTPKIVPGCEAQA